MAGSTEPEASPAAAIPSLAEGLPSENTRPGLPPGRVDLAAPWPWWAGAWWLGSKSRTLVASDGGCWGFVPRHLRRTSTSRGHREAPVPFHGHNGGPVSGASAVLDVLRASTR